MAKQWKGNGKKQKETTTRRKQKSIRTNRKKTAPHREIKTIWHRNKQRNKDRTKLTVVVTVSNEAFDRMIR